MKTALCMTVRLAEGFVKHGCSAGQITGINEQESFVSSLYWNLRILPQSASKLADSSLPEGASVRTRRFSIILPLTSCASKGSDDCGRTRGLMLALARKDRLCNTRESVSIATLFHTILYLHTPRHSRPKIQTENFPSAHSCAMIK